MKCQGCGHENPPEARFCANCGADLAGMVEPPSPAPSPPTEPSAERAGFWRRYKWGVTAFATVTIVVGIIGWQVERAPSPGMELALPHSTTKTAPQVGALAPDFTLPTLDGATVTLSDLQGKHPVWALRFIQLLRCFSIYSFIIEQKERKFINRMNLYLRDFFIYK